MPIELQIIRAREFIRLGAKGYFDLDASKAVLGQLAGACCKRGINQALLDLRALHPGPKPVFSPNDLVTLVDTFREAGFTHQQRLAVLYGSDPHHRARLFAFIAKLRGWKVQAFDSFEDAVHWLSGGEELQVETEFTPEAKSVQVRNLKQLNAASQAKSDPRIKVKSKIPPASSRQDSTPVPVRTGKIKSSSARIAATASRLV
ncbi:MAG TPA: hypothetical protein VNN22_22160 [Verrucomicrobiae bacterium]|nr:hypothetical protein [Verrucomicrobiae bacterium]